GPLVVALSFELLRGCDATWLVREFRRAEWMSAGIARIKRSALAALPATSGTDFRPQVREPAHRIILEARAVRQEKFPDLLEVLDREHALALASPATEDLSGPELLELDGQRGLRNADRRLDIRARPH